MYSTYSMYSRYRYPVCNHPVFLQDPEDFLVPGMSSAVLIDVLEHVMARIEEVGGAAPGDRTMLDALGPLLDAMASADLPELPAVAELWTRGADAAEAGAVRTASMVAAAGRTSYLSEEEARGTEDPGARSVAIWSRAVAKALEEA